MCGAVRMLSRPFVAARRHGHGPSSHALLPPHLTPDHPCSARWPRQPALTPRGMVSTPRSSRGMVSTPRSNVAWQRRSCVAEEIRDKRTSTRHSIQGMLEKNRAQASLVRQRMERAGGRIPSHDGTKPLVPRYEAQIQLLLLHCITARNIRLQR